MSATTLPLPPSTAGRPGAPQAVRSQPAAPASSENASPLIRNRQDRGGRVLFQIPFRRELTDADLAQLARTFDLSTHMSPKWRPDPNSPGVARLDHFSGLFLERGSADGEWVLEARTWGRPAPESVHEWHLIAAGAARRLDRSVKIPQRLPAAPVQIAERPVGEVLNRRFARFRRRLVGLP